MKPCQDHQESLLLDVYGELAPNERPAWERHLEVCEGCRQERERLLHLLQRLKETMPSPTLSPERASVLADSVKRNLKGEQKKTWWEKKLWGFSNRLIPALAAVCLVIAAVGWFSMREYRPSPSFRAISKLKSEEQMIAKDLELIKNLELLEEMDVIQKLVRVVDDRKGI